MIWNISIFNWYSLCIKVIEQNGNQIIINTDFSNKLYKDLLFFLQKLDFLYWNKSYHALRWRVAGSCSHFLLSNTPKAEQWEYVMSSALKKSLVKHKLCVTFLQGTNEWVTFVLEICVVKRFFTWSYRIKCNYFLFVSNIFQCGILYALFKQKTSAYRIRNAKIETKWRDKTDQWTTKQENDDYAKFNMLHQFEWVVLTLQIQSVWRRRTFRLNDSIARMNVLI